jgi:hypothetical protein
VLFDFRLSWILGGKPVPGISEFLPVALGGGIACREQGNDGENDGSAHVASPNRPQTLAQKVWICFSRLDQDFAILYLSPM